MSIVRHKYLNNTVKSKKIQKHQKSKPINKISKTGNKNIDIIINKRYIFITVIIILFFLVITIRLFNIQVLKYHDYKHLKYVHVNYFVDIEFLMKKVHYYKKYF